MRECLSCNKLGACNETTEERLLTHYSCVLWETASQSVQVARTVVLSRYGHSAAGPMINLEPPPEEED